MSDDSFTEVTHESWFSRLGNAVKGIVVGLVLLAAAGFLLFWNEGRAVKTAQGLAEGKGSVVSISPDKVDAENNGKLVHLTAETRSDDVLKDPLFGISTEALKLYRIVEMYQWDEKQESKTKDKVGGGTTTVTNYTYEKKWSKSLIDSDDFQASKRSQHTNPTRMRYEPESDVADPVMVGAFKLSSGLLGQMNDTVELPVTEQDLEKVDADIREQFKVYSGAFYASAKPESPEVGDTRVRFEIVEPATVSLLAKQAGESFTPYATKTIEIERLRVSAMSAEEMFAAEERDNNIMTWLLRGAGFVLMMIGINTVFRPLVVFVGVLPFLGDLVGMGVGVFSFLIAAAGSLTVIAFGWLAYRPLLGVALLIGAAGLVILLKVLGGSRRAAKTAAEES